LIADKKGSSSGSVTSATVGKLRHLTDDADDSLLEDSSDVLPDPPSNDTNGADLMYFVCMSKHYLRLVNSTSSRQLCHKMLYPIIADSGANFHMFHDPEFFVSMSQASGNLILGDGTTTLSIKGVGRIKCKIGDHILFVDGVRYVPDLSESIYSLFLHIKLPDHSVQSSSDKGLFINLPEFKSLAIIGESDIYLDATPMGDPSVISLINETSKSPPSSSTMTSTDAICNHTIQDQSNIINKQKHPENILKSLRQYYSEIQTKRKLNMNLPAGFRQDSTIQRNYKEFLPPPDTSSKPVPTSDDFHLLSTFSESLPDDTEVNLTSTAPPTPVSKLVFVYSCAYSPMCR
jgi:hypothetical protein